MRRPTTEVQSVPWACAIARTACETNVVHRVTPASKEWLDMVELILLGNVAFTDGAPRLLLVNQEEMQVVGSDGFVIGNTASDSP